MRRYNGSANLDDWSGDIAVDNSGNVYVTGSVNGLLKGVAAAEGTTGFHPADANLKRSIESSVAVEADFCTVKYYPNGDTAWVMTYDGPSGGNDSAAAMALDVVGNVYVTGSSSTEETSIDLATIKYVEDAMH